METAISFILQHKQSKLFISYTPDNYHTSKLKQARRFMDDEQIQAFMSVSCYAPDNPDDYVVRTMKINYELECVEHGIIPS